MSDLRARISLRALVDHAFVSRQRPGSSVPESSGARTRTIAVEGTVTVPHSPNDLWPFVADLDRFDRAVGLPLAHVTRIPQQEGGEEVWGEYRRFGLRIARWREHPFEWVRPHRYTVVREYDVGPLVRFFGGAELISTDTGTTIWVFAQFTPRKILFDPLIRFWIAPVSIRRAIRQYRAIDAFLSGRTLDPFPDLARQRGRVDIAHLEGCMRRLAAEGVPSVPAAHLRRALAEAADEDVAGLRPFELADRWGTDRRQTLQTFLQGTVAGLLEMRWELLCPSCRGVKADAAHLKELDVTGYCAACHLPFAASIDEGIEARFYPAGSIRDLNVGTYCIGNPMNTPHRIAQTTLEPNETREWHLYLAPGSYLIRSPQSRGVVSLTAEPDSANRTVEVNIEPEVMTPEMARVARGRVTIRLANHAQHRTMVALDDARWSDTGATPSRLLTQTGFNTLFSAEALAPGVELAIARVGLLFTDLAGSTALYERVGDARAFRLVTEHFTVLRRAIEGAGGAMVKTIGDAVMAAFPDGASALAAGLAIQREIHALDTRGLADPARLVKVGVHSGPSYLVTLNDRLDYFGTTVNIAARAQHEARGGEVVATAAVIEEAEAVLEDPSLRAEAFEVRLRGLSEPIQLHRLTPLAVASQSPTDVVMAQGGATDG